MTFFPSQVPKSNKNNFPTTTTTKNLNNFILVWFMSALIIKSCRSLLKWAHILYYLLPKARTIHFYTNTTTAVKNGTYICWGAKQCAIICCCASNEILVSDVIRRGFFVFTFRALMVCRSDFEARLIAVTSRLIAIIIEEKKKKRRKKESDGQSRWD